MTELIKRLTEVSGEDVGLAGGKAASLGELIGAELPVPGGFVLTTEAYRRFSDGQIPEDFRTELARHFSELGAGRVSVRSSAIAEDSANASWAGQFESLLNVTRGGLVGAIHKCWQSANAETVRAYASENGIEDDKLALAVVVQAMVDSEVSGVAFSINPVTKRVDEIMIEATYGLGEMLVQGLVTPDNYIASKTSGKILNRSVNAKTKALIYKNGVNTEVEVDEPTASAACLSDRQIAELSALVKKIEQHYDLPQDIEWAFAGGKFYILQSRPITTL